jgi:hypothetical protein
MIQVFLPEIGECGQHRIGSSSAQTAQTSFLGAVRQFFEGKKVFGFSISGTYFIENFEHAAGAYPAKGTLSARLILGKRQKIPRHVHHAIVFIQHHQTT